MNTTTLEFVAIRFRQIRREQPALSLGDAMDAAIDSVWFSQRVPAKVRAAVRLYLLTV
jgi:hypothetical protein